MTISHSTSISNDDFIFESNKITFYEAAYIYILCNDDLEVDFDDLDEMEESFCRLGMGDFYIYTPGFNDFKDVSLEQFLINYVLEAGYATRNENSGTPRVVVEWIKQMTYSADVDEIDNREIDFDEGFSSTQGTCGYDYLKWNYDKREFDWE